ncbi:M20 family metallopeptidase [Bacteroidales bacterium OttesenSCG-928-I21]|nr:M20 family metallopeptidase [Bacteroidales bacterium OttesenSCG-928-I21]
MDQIIIDTIKEKSKKLLPLVTEVRRHIHKFPELSFQEFETAKYIKNILTEHKIEIDDSFGDNTVIGIVKGQKPGKTIALRADIDALPINEENNVEYKSQNAGIMHACGHDAHTASLIGTGIILKELSNILRGTVILIFQPAEERNPGGAKILIEQGVLKKYKIENIIAQHVTPEIKTGNFCFGSGILMASTDELYIEFHGIGGHAALPEKRGDTVLAIVDFIKKANELQNELNTKEPVVIAFGKVIAEGSVNVIPAMSKAEGTMRTFDENTRKYIKEHLTDFSKKIAKSHACTANFEIRTGYPSLINNTILSEKILEITKNYIPSENIEQFTPRMTSEDFAFFSREIPAVLYRTGIEGNGLGKIGVHHPNFDIDENFFSYSVGLMAHIAFML